MVADKIRKLKEKVQQRERDVEAKREASRNRVARGDPKTAGEKVRVAAKEARDLGESTTSFLKTKAAPARSAADRVSREGNSDDRGDGGAFGDFFAMPNDDAREMAGEAEQRVPQPDVPNTVIADEQTTVVTPESAVYSQELGERFDDVSVADTDGIVEPGDIRVGEDINADGDLDRGEVFRAVSPPRETEEVPRNEDKFDDILI